MGILMDNGPLDILHNYQNRTSAEFKSGNLDNARL